MRKVCEDKKVTMLTLWPTPDFLHCVFCLHAPVHPPSLIFVANRRQITFEILGCIQINERVEDQLLALFIHKQCDKESIYSYKLLEFCFLLTTVSLALKSVNSVG